jgi:DNA helicase II / ATP-dependent DNA helicase PcrA
MSTQDQERSYEEKRLGEVLDEIGLQLGDKKESRERYKQEVIQVHRLMWEEVTPGLNYLNDINELDQLVQVKQYLDELKRKAVTNEFYNKQAYKLERMYNSPYFGRMDFLEDGEAKPEMIYVGLGTLKHSINGEYLVYDWRAPISSLFYDHENGRAGYVCPQSIIEGEILMKRQYRISKGKIELMFDSSVKIDDDILQEILGKSSDSRMKTIVASIQREQNKVIRDDSHRILMVQGAAGSGKTSIALHRIAYLLYKYRDTVSAENIIIFSPNPVFNDYISNVLPELGEENMYQTTFQEYAAKTLKKEYTVENAGQQMEYLLAARGNSRYKDRLAGIRYKASEAFADLLKNYVTYLENEGMQFDTIVYQNQVIMTKEEARELVSKEYAVLPLGLRLEKLKSRIFYLLEPLGKQRTLELQDEMKNSDEYFSEEEIKLKSRLKVMEEFRELRESLERRLSLDPYEAYVRLFTDADLHRQLSGSELPDEFEDMGSYTREQLALKYITYEDTAPLLYLKGAFGYLPNLGDIRYVVIDEMQDYTPLHFRIFRQLFPYSSLTMLGDLNQAINPYMNVGQYDTIGQIFKESSKVLINLTKSYRSTREIADFARGILEVDKTVEYLNRHGEKPALIQSENWEQLYRSISEEVTRLQENGMKSVAVICRTATECKKAHQAFGKAVKAHLITTDDEEYVRGVVVVPSYLAKGLEFDAVLVCGAGAEEYGREEERRLLYTVCTRAMHALKLYYTGSVSPLLKEIDTGLYTKNAQ